MPDSLVQDFGHVLVEEDWSCLQAGMSPVELVDIFQASASRMVDHHFPKKLVSVTHGKKKPILQ